MVRALSRHPVRRFPAAATGIASAVLAAMVLAGCTTTLTPVPEAPVGLEDFYGQTLGWQPCVSEPLECASLTAPIDYADPVGGSIELALIRLPSASDERQGSLLMNPGGPGGSGYDFVANAATFVTTPLLRQNFDIVGWDPRGVGRSAPVTCYDPGQMDEYLYGVPDNPVGSDAWFAERAEDGRAFAEACAVGTGELLGHIDAVSTARDMDLMRAVLGDDSLTYLGFSYGTVFGTEYARLFPESVGRVVLDGAVDPSLPQQEVFPTQMSGFEGAYRAFLEFCVDQNGCPFSGNPDDASAQSADLFAGVDAAAMIASDGRQLTAATLGTALAYPLYDEGSWPALVEMLADLEAGDPTAAFEFADGYNGRIPGGGYESNSVESYTAALCLDGEYSTDVAGTAAVFDAIATAAPTTGPYLAYGDWVLVDSACRSWPFEPTRSAEPVAAAGADPILVVGTTNDPATPYSWAQALAEQLDSGVLVTRNGEGHTAYGRGNACIDETVDVFLVSGEAPETDPLC